MNQIGFQEDIQVRMQTIYFGADSYHYFDAKIYESTILNINWPVYDQTN